MPPPWWRPSWHDSHGCCNPRTPHLAAVAAFGLASGPHSIRGPGNPLPRPGTPAAAAAAMAVAVADIGKAVRDVLYGTPASGSYSYDPLKLSYGTKTADGVALTLGAVKKDDKADLSLRTVYNFNNYGLTAVFNTSDKVAVTASVDKIAPGVKLALAATLPDTQSGKLLLDYVNKQVHIKTSVGLTTQPKVTVSAATAINNVVFGGEAAYDTAKSAVSNYGVAVGLHAGDSQLGIHLQVRHRGGAGGSRRRGGSRRSSSSDGGSSRPAAAACRPRAPPSLLRSLTRCPAPRTPRAGQAGDAAPGGGAQRVQGQGAGGGDQPPRGRRRRDVHARHRAPPGQRRAAQDQGASRALALRPLCVACLCLRGGGCMRVLVEWGGSARGWQRAPPGGERWRCCCARVQLRIWLPSCGHYWRGRLLQPPTRRSRAARRLPASRRAAAGRPQRHPVCAVRAAPGDGREVCAEHAAGHAQHRRQGAQGRLCARPGVSRKLRRRAAEQASRQPSG